jgi:hypothetical protein
VAADDVLESVAAALGDHFGQPPAVASVTFLGVEPIDVLRFEPIPGEIAYLSLGMSRHPMTASDQVVVSGDGPRAELMLSVRADERFTDVWRRLAVLAAAPAVEGVVYVPGMTVDTGEPLAPGSRCTGGVVQQSAVDAVATSAGAVQIYAVVPATSTELAWSRVHGTDALVQRWHEARTDLLDLARNAVQLG